MLRAVNKNLHLEIVLDYPDVGVYLYVYSDGKCIRDDLQDDIETCKRVACDDYDVPLDGWCEITNDVK